ncbi:hypothetical protein FJV41_18250 [Myxococcus llanfairpwllgwyngyllgogerychwyrndrobwllllantysiliogogogochensis]|uniref:Lipoprotein n=1 Tax=Myxococcus llanfairpwllgwyngyllgogerychwyrndrobwllllantysiliogogogochensis TaxID=2590453 RepID=A0A540X1H5_9BACT|nr:hypothetical protein [Myxococcus llanfairpwllgwyngyllgogerychwyrndrobwllllantysiliogogogochensis]TQF14524.1 hypothetical protein FJV41_18250 [Myxococcus llanfairpwllgwyngyllgogerychwyrndrobwllllantysiliogogogochensis]
MRSWFSLSVCLTFLSLGCGISETPSTPEDLRDSATEALVSGVSSLEGVASGASTRWASREPVFGDVAHYRFELQVGPGAHDTVTVHRVVKERAPWVPARANRAVFLVHGDAWGFDAAFLSSVGSAHVPANHSIAAYLAQENVDVWGIDMRWVGVPAGTQDFGFMAGWNLGTHAKDVGTGLLLARTLRLAGGNVGSMHLLAWSRGAMVAFAYLNSEARLPRLLRQVDGFIPVDMAVRHAPQFAQQQAWACERHTALKARRDAGVTEGGLLGPAPGITLQYIGLLAATAPDAPSPLLPDDVFGPGTGRPTNRRAAIVSAAATGALLAPLPALTPGYHLMAGIPDATGLPGSMTYTSEPYLYEYAQRAAPYQSLNEVVESDAWTCGLDVPYDDHLQRVTVPVLYVGAGGGVGEYGVHSTTLLGSQDVSSLVVRDLPTAARALDFGHADLFLADTAPQRVWQPILQWVRAH